MTSRFRRSLVARLCDKSTERKRHYVRISMFDWNVSQSRSHGRVIALWVGSGGWWNAPSTGTIIYIANNDWCAVVGVHFIRLKRKPSRARFCVCVTFFCHEQRRDAIFIVNVNNTCLKQIGTPREHTHTCRNWSSWRGARTLQYCLKCLSKSAAGNPLMEIGLVRYAPSWAPHVPKRRELTYFRYIINTRIFVVIINNRTAPIIWEWTWTGPNLCARFVHISRACTQQIAHQRTRTNTHTEPLSRVSN